VDGWEIKNRIIIMQIRYLSPSDIFKIINSRKGLFDYHKYFSDLYGEAYIGNIGEQVLIDGSRYQSRKDEKLTN